MLDNIFIRRGDHHRSYINSLITPCDVGPRGHRMHQSRVIEIAGQFAGAALHQGESFRFVAVDPRVKDLDRSLWSTLHEMEHVVSILLTSRRLPTQQVAP